MKIHPSLFELTLLLLKPQVSSGMSRWRCRWAWSKWTWSTPYGVSQPAADGRGARVYTCTCVHDSIPCRRLPK